MKKYLYTTLLLALLAQEGVMAQENEGKKGGFFGKIKDTFSTEIKIGNYTFKDGSVYTGEMKGRKPNGKGKTVCKKALIVLPVLKSEWDVSFWKGIPACLHKS